MEDTILWNTESDNYTKRAQSLLKEKLFTRKKDMQDVQKILDALPHQCVIKNVLDIGCAHGSLATLLAKRLPAARVVGIDPGKRTVAYAKRVFKGQKNLSFHVGYSHKLPIKESFDLVILRMVLQWIPRAYLLYTVAEIDRACSKFIYIQDFYPHIPSTSVSIHNKQVRIFKQDYTALFTSTLSYKIIYQELWDTDEGDNFQRGHFLLKKYPLDHTYLARTAVQEKTHAIS